MNFLDEKLPTRFWNKVIPEPNSGCWIWTAGLTGGGYGGFRIEGKQLTAHRVTYSVVNGAAPLSLDLDHLCRTRCCVNPQHLEAVTRRENLMRGDTISAKNANKTHCSRGHEFTADNTWASRHHVHRQCKTCFYAKRRERMSEQPANDRKAGAL